MIRALSLLLCFHSLYGLGQMKTLVVLGSSTAEGVGAVPRDSSWVAKINYRYRNVLGLLDTTYNLASGGHTPYHAMPDSYVPPPYRPMPDTRRNISRAISLTSDVIVVAYASNKYDEYSTEEVMFTLQTIKDSAERAGIVCFIATTQPQNHFDAAGRLKLKTLKDSILNRFGFYAINFWDPIVDPSDNGIAARYRFPYDNIHLNNAGHRVLYEQVLAKDILNAALPIRIKKFKAQAKFGYVVLSWTTVDSEPNLVFDVFRGDGQRFDSIGQVKAKAGQQENSYQFVDRNPTQGNNYYRLRLRYSQGQFFSSTVFLNISPHAFGVKKVYPVPAVNTLHLDLTVAEPVSVQIQVVSASGAVWLRKVHSLTRDGVVSLDLGRIPSGSYKLILHSGQFSVTIPIVKQ